MNKEVFIQAFKNAKELNESICVEVTIPGQEETEYIVNKPSSLDNKLTYYLETYDDNLVHKNNTDIKIVNAFNINLKGM